jgi:hypothetical protein
LKILGLLFKGMCPVCKEGNGEVAAAGTPAATVETAPSSTLKCTCQTPTAEWTRSTSWGSDSRFKGAYSYIGISGTGADYDIMAEPVGYHEEDVKGEVHHETDLSTLSENSSIAELTTYPKVFFAGEATNRCVQSTFAIFFTFQH